MLNCDFIKYNLLGDIMKKMLLKIAYDGTDYHGWQVQPNGITVQEALQDVIEKLIGERPDVTGCSRTDAGVHAKEFYCHFCCDDKYPDVTFVKGLNSVLPRDIFALECKAVPDDFHARYSAKGKRYVYKIKQTNPNPFDSRYSWYVSRKLNAELMNEFCKRIVGTHDFYGFSSSGRTVEDTVRTVSECNCKYTDNGDIIFTVEANGFLYNMVRILVGTAVGVSDGKIQLEDIDSIFANKDRSLAGVTAPPEGLFLDKVFY